MTLQAPYRFVPLSRFVLRPDWGQQVSHDHPFSDGVCGELELELTTQTPLCVGGEQTPASEHKPGSVHFYRTPNNQLAIPGSSLKGMLRNVLEIACFGHFSQVQDQRLGVRDISKGDNFYSKAMNRTTVCTGWLQFDNGEWKITPCDYVRILQEELIAHLNIRAEVWKGKKTAPERYTLLQGLRPIQFDIDFDSYKADCKKQATNLGRGTEQGTLVVTGQPGPAFDQGKSAKKREFVFYNPKPENTLTVGEKALQGFMQIHGETKEWEYWLGQLNTLVQGVPVFFHKDAQGQIKSIGLARMYKLAYEHSLHDAIGHTNTEHLDTAQADLAGLLFGWIDEQDKTGSHNLRGRVQAGLFAATNDTPTHWQQPTVLSNPKPTFYPAYIQQNPSGAYKTLMDKTAELAGWKRYPVQADAHLPELTSKVKENNKVQVRLETAPANSTFTGKIRFHNLRMIELGALLWALDFNQSKNSSHALGMGKPFGFGQVRLKLTGSQTRPNSQCLSELSDDLRLATARRAFLHYMTHAWQQVTGKPDAEWEKSPQVAALLATTNPDVYKRENLNYHAEPKEFMKDKQEGLRFAVNPAIQEVQLPKTLPVSVSEDSRKTLGDFAREAQEALNEQQQADAKATEIANKRKNMTPEQIRMDELDQELQSGQISKSFSKKLKKLYEEAFAWPVALKQELCELAQRVWNKAEELGKTQDDFGKQAKKILRDHNPDSQ